jgi:hypothetical protein
MNWSSVLEHVETVFQHAALSRDATAYTFPAHRGN